MLTDGMDKFRNSLVKWDKIIFRTIWWEDLQATTTSKRPCYPVLHHLISLQLPINLARS